MTLGALWQQRLALALVQRKLCDVVPLRDVSSGVDHDVRDRRHDVRDGRHDVRDGKRRRGRLALANIDPRLEYCNRSGWLLEGRGGYVEGWGGYVEGQGGYVERRGGYVAGRGG